MKIFYAALFCSAVFLLNGCTQKPILLTPPQGRLDYLGFSLIPPTGERWFLVETSKEGVRFEKQIANRHMLVATARETQVLTKFKDSEEFVSWIGQARERTWAEQQYKVVEHQETLDHSLGADCAKYHMRLMNAKAPDTNGRNMVLLLDGYSCRHPLEPLLMIEISYQEQYDPDRHSPVDRAWSDTYLKTLRFDPVRQDRFGGEMVGVGVFR